MLSVSLLFGYVWHTAGSDDMVFYVRADKQNTKYIEYYCHAYEEKEGSVVLYFSSAENSEKTIINTDNYASITIRKIPKKNIDVPAFLKKTMYNISYPIEYRDIKDSIADNLRSLSSKVTKNFDINYLRKVNSVLNEINKSKDRIKEKNDSGVMEINKERFYIGVNNGLIRRTGSFDSEIIRGLKFGTPLTVLDNNSNWIKVAVTQKDTGWVNKSITIKTNEEL